MVGHGQTGPGKRIPFKAQRERPQLTPEQMRLQEERLRRHKDTHGDPALPEAPASQTPAGAPTASPLQVRPGPTEVLPIGGTFTIFQQTAQTQPGTSFDAETQAATNGPIVFYSGNLFASFSTDGGASFTFVDPYTQFDPLDGGFCCDQTVIYDPTRDLMIWQLQYFWSPSTNKGSYRIAFANPASVASAGWCTYEFNPGSFGLDPGRSLDRPSVALSNNFVWYSANIYTEPDPKWEQTVMWRIPLDVAANCPSLAFDFFLDTQNFHFTPVAGAVETMYWASIGTGPVPGQIRIYQWAEADSMPSSTVRFVSPSWPNFPRRCPGPDGLNWCDRADKRSAAGWISNGVIGFMWSASQGFAGDLGPFRYPYVHVARFNASTLARIDEPIIWNASGAWIYPAVAVNERGDIAGTLYFGGGGYFPIMTALILDDLSPAPAPWEIYGFVGSDAGADRWGDYYSSRRNGSNGNTWVISGQQVTGGQVNAWYVWMGRDRDAPPTEMTSSGVQGTSPTSASSDYLRFWWEDVLRQRPPARSP